MRSDEIAALLRAKYCAPEWAFFEEVSRATGGGHRRADAIAMNLWPSRGLTIEGFEIKVSRGDWVRELKSPAKAEQIARFCDHWWLVVSDSDIISAGELPETWGLIACDRGKLKTLVVAGSNPSPQLDRGFVASMLRRAAESSASEQELRAARQLAFKEGEDSVRHRLEYDMNNQRRELDGLRKAVYEFERQSGMRFSEYSYGNISKIVRHIGREQFVDNVTRNLKRELENLREASAVITDALDQISKLPSRGVRTFLPDDSEASTNENA